MPKFTNIALIFLFFEGLQKPGGMPESSSFCFIRDFLAIFARPEFIAAFLYKRRIPCQIKRLEKNVASMKKCLATLFHS